MRWITVGATLPLVVGCSKPSVQNAHALPTGRYQLETRAVSDTCDPMMNKTDAPDVLVTSFIVGHDSARQMKMNVPAPASLAQGGIARSDIHAEQGATANWNSAIPACAGATRKNTLRVDAMRSDGFDATYIQELSGVESCTGRETAAQLPKAACRSEQRLHFTLQKEICPAECAFTSTGFGSSFEGKCQCKDNK